jgi:hypothetical protein
MTGADQVDVLRSLLLEIHNHADQSGWRNHIALAILADIVVLAKKTPQVAPGEEDGARSVGAGYWRLLAVVEAE